MKKYFGIGLVAVLLGAAVWLSVGRGSGNGAVNASVADAGEQTEAGSSIAVSGVAETNYFEDFRTERDSVREQEMVYLDEVIAASAADSETLEDAMAQKLAIVDNMEKEFTIESEIKAKGFTDAAVTFHQGTVNVVVEAKELTAEEAAQILEIAMRESGEKAENIKIMTKGE